MIDLLIARWMKDGSADDPALRAALGKRAGLTGLFCNVLLFAVKLALGLRAASVSLVADAVNNLSDAASSVITLFGFRLAQRPADRDHPYGHARYEYISGLAVAAIILLIGLELARSSVDKILHPQTVFFTATMFWLLLLSLVVKFWLFLFFRRLGKKIRSATLLAASADSRNDVISSSAVLAGAVVGSLTSFSLDGYVGLGVALFILWSGIGIVRTTISPLLGERADKKLVEQIEQAVLVHPEILGVHDLLVHDYGPGQCYASLHAEMNAEEEPLRCHDIIDEIECEVLDSLQVHLVIHYDPVVVNDEEWSQMRGIVEEILAGIDPRLSMHDFRMVRGAEKTKLVFDLSLPYDQTGQSKEFAQRIESALRDRGKNYKTVIRFDAE